MMGGVSPETCWASYKYGIIKFWYIVASCCIFLHELYYDARIHDTSKVILFYNIVVRLYKNSICDICGRTQL
jgi:hypothetical protein